MRLIPAQFVKPYVKSNKTDVIDAEAIAEAATRPTMRFAALKSEEQADPQALHRVRDQVIGTRTRLINQMRAFSLEYGIARRQGAGLFKLDPAVTPDTHPFAAGVRWLVMRVCAGEAMGGTRSVSVVRSVSPIAVRWAAYTAGV